MSIQTPRTIHQEDECIRRVYYTGSDEMKAGYALCHDRDNITAIGVAGTALAAANASHARHIYVEKPASGNLHNFAGLVATDSAGKTGPCWLNIVVPNCPGTVLTPFTDQSCTIDSTLLTVKAASYIVGGAGQGVVIGKALQTINRSSTNGTVQAALAMPNPLEKAYGDAVPSSTNNALSPAIWEGCPWNEIGRNPSLGYRFFDDFLQVGATTAPWVIVGTNGTAAGLATAEGGVVRVSGPGTDNDECTFSSNNNAAGMIKLSTTGKRLWYETRVRPSQVATAQGIFVGFLEETGAADTNFTDDTTAMEVLDSIGFQVVSAADGAACSYIDTIIQLTSGALVQVADHASDFVAATWINLGMVYDGGTMTFYVNGVALADTVASTATNFPLDQVMQLAWGVKCGSAAVSSLDVDWVRVAQLR